MTSNASVNGGKGCTFDRTKRKYVKMTPTKKVGVKKKRVKKKKK